MEDKIIDDYFWLAWARQRVIETPGELSKQLESIQKILIWTISLGALGGFAQISLVEDISIGIVIISALPIPVLIYAYFQTINGKTINISDSYNEKPADKLKGDLRDPDVVPNIYQELVLKRLENIRYARKWATIAISMTVLCLLISPIITRYGRNKIDGFKATFYMSKQGDLIMSLTGHMPPNDSIWLYRYYTLKEVKSASKGEVVVKEKKKLGKNSIDPLAIPKWKSAPVSYFTNNKSGDFQFSIPLVPGTDKISLRIEHKVGEKFHSIRRELSLESDEIPVDNGILKELKLDPNLLNKTFGEN